MRVESLLTRVVKRSTMLAGVYPGFSLIHARFDANVKMEGETVKIHR